MKRFQMRDLTPVIALIVLAACSPEFNAKKKAILAAARAPAGTRVTNNTSAFDPHTAGGGAVGTSTSYRMSGVNVGHYSKKPTGTATGYGLKGGINGQLGDDQ